MEATDDAGRHPETLANTESTSCQGSVSFNDLLQASLLEERRLIANEVHDSLAQNLTFMRMRVKLLHDALARTEVEEASQYLNEIEESLSVAHGRVRELIAHFRTAPVIEGIVPALNKEIESLNRLGDVKLDFDNRVGELTLKNGEDIQVFYIVREALANIIKHARARHGVVRIKRKAGRCRIEISDDGQGFAGRAGGYGHYGLNIMRERARRLGGKMEFGASVHGGAQVCLSFPLSRH